MFSSIQIQMVKCGNSLAGSCLCLVLAAVSALAAGPPALSDSGVAGPPAPSGSGVAGWPQHRGPERNGISKETDWFRPWPAEGPKVLWAANLGCGYAEPAVVGGRVYVEGSVDEQMRVFCLDTETGREIWTFDYEYPLRPPSKKDAAPSRYSFLFPGATGTPTVEGDSVYVYSRAGQLFCLDARSGKPVWQETVPIKYVEHGLACGPLIHGDLVIVMAGGKDNLFRAHDKKTGKLVWARGMPQAEKNWSFNNADCNSPVPFSYKGEPALASLCGHGLCGFRLKDGAFLFNYKWSTTEHNLTEPVISGDRIFLATECYPGKKNADGTPVPMNAMFKIPDAPGPITPLWEGTTLNTALLATPILLDGKLYSLCFLWGNRRSQEIRCVDFDTGNLRWSSAKAGGAIRNASRYGDGGNFMLADGKLIILTEAGELLVVEANPDKYVPLARAKVFGSTGAAPADIVCFASPVLANGRIYCRSTPVGAGERGTAMKGLKPSWLVCVDPKAAGDKAGATSAASPPKATGNPKAESAPAPAPAPAIRTWQRFHGPDGTGFAPGGRAPVEWNAATGKNIRWKLPLPLPGLSSPIVHGDRLFLTGADAKTQRLFAVDRLKGTILWEKPVSCQRAFAMDEIQVDLSVGYAAPTPATDGEVLVTFFATGDMAVFDMDGKPLWSRNLEKSESAFGLAASPVIGDGRIYLQYPGADGPQVMALDKTSGKTVWSISPKDMEETWASPLLLDTGKRRELVFLAGPGFWAFDPATGKELWRAAGISGQIGPSPLLLGDTLYGVQAGNSLLAVRSGGMGDVTRTHVRWQAKEGLPDTASPATDGTRIYLTALDEVTCYQAATGKLLWKQELTGEYYSSPVVVGDKVYATTRQGLTYVFKAGDRYERLGQGDAGEAVDSSPAVAGDQVYLRGEKHLFCIAEEAK